MYVCMYVHDHQWTFHPWDCTIDFPLCFCDYTKQPWYIHIRSYKLKHIALSVLCTRRSVPILYLHACILGPCMFFVCCHHGHAWSWLMTQLWSFSYIWTHRSFLRQQVWNSTHNPACAKLHYWLKLISDGSPDSGLCLIWVLVGSH